MDAVAMLLVGGSTTLVGKIVWDWLSKNNGNGAHNCPYIQKIDNMSSSIHDLNERTARIETNVEWLVKEGRK